MTSTKAIGDAFDAAMADIGVSRCPRCRDTECCGASDLERIEGLILALGQIARIGHAATGLVEAREALDKCVAIARKAIVQ